MQLRKISTDVYDQVKTIKGSVDLNQALEKERELNRQLLVKLQQETDDKVQEIWNQVRG